MAQEYTVKEFNGKVNELLAALSNNFPLISARLSRTALSLVRNRIINTGIDANGKPFGKYSTNPLPFFFFQNKGLSNGADKKVESLKKAQGKGSYTGEKGMSYEQWRKANGLQTNFVDLKFTGETLRDIDVLETEQQGDVFITTVASKNSVKKNKYKADGTKNGSTTTGEITEHLGNKYGNFLTMNEVEVDDIAIAFEDEIQTLFNQTFGS